jgi:hypothetical protein
VSDVSSQVRGLQRWRYLAEVSEERYPVAKEHGYKIDLDHVQEPSVQTLLRDVGADDSDRLFAGDGFRLL